MKQLTLRIPSEIHKQIKVQVAREETSMLAFVLRAVQKELNQCQEKKN